MTSKPLPVKKSFGESFLSGLNDNKKDGELKYIYGTDPAFDKIMKLRKKSLIANCILGFLFLVFAILSIATIASVSSLGSQIEDLES